ncbi:MAG: FlgD immunoglobulin-like domain containing protein, partial [Candidatus Eiseniibacteriota bacterium]
EALVNAVEEGGEPGGGIAVASRLLRQNRPNPFNPRTSIAFEVPEGAGQVQLAVFDVDGRHVLDLVDGAMATGEHTVEWDGRDAQGEALASGLYYYRLQVDGHSEVRSMILLR